MMKRLTLLSVAILAALSTWHAASATEGALKVAAPVQGSSGVERTISLDGVVEAINQTTLSAQVAGAVVEIRVKAGDRVKAGQALLRLDARAAQQGVVATVSQVEAAQAQLNVARSELERQKQLRQKEYISQAALERAQAQWEAAQAQVSALQAQTRAARTQADFFVVSAPYPGIVSDVAVKTGDMAMPGRPLLVMHDPAALRVTASVPEALLAGLADRIDKVRYELPKFAGREGPQRPARTELLPAIDPSTHTAEIRLGMGALQPGVAPGMFARVLLPAVEETGRRDEDRLYVPLASVVRRAELSAVYVVDDNGKPRLRQVRLGRSAGEFVEVLSGVRKDDRIAVDPQAAASLR